MKYALFVFHLLVFSCAGVQETRDAQNSLPPQKQRAIKYADLELIYDYAISKNRDATAVLERMKKIQSEIAAIETGDADSGQDSGAAALLDSRKKQLRELEAKSQNIKIQELALINAAVKTAASRYRCDFILNRNDGLLYGAKEHDLTDEIIMELNSMRQKSSAVTR